VDCLTFAVIKYGNMSYIDYKIDSRGIGLLSFNRPEKYHAFHTDLLKELAGVLDAEMHNSELRLLLIRGRGEKAFSSGVDLTSLLELDTVEKAREFALLLEGTSEKIFHFPRPTIALINGLAMGGGLGFSTAADIRIMSNKAKIGYPAVKLGAILPATCTLYLQALVGAGRAKDLLLTGKMLSAEEALHTGIVQYTADPDQLMDKAYALAEQILEGGDTALLYTKNTVNYSLRKEIESAKLYAADNFAFLSRTKDWQERMLAFSNKKK
jgi:enoyl-CoA hydratase